MILHPIIDLLKRIVVDLPDYVNPSGGGEDLLEKRITNTLTEYRSTNTMTLANSAFINCTALTSLFLPNTVLGAYCVRGSNLETLVVGSTGATQTVYGATRLQAVDIIGSSGTIYNQTFTTCSNLDVLIIRRSSLVSLASTNVFNGTPFEDGGTGGTLYVPQSLISSYQNATNWSTILGYANNQILPIEGSYYETHYADGTEITS